MDKFKAHILLVDDDEGIRSLVKKYLNENNFFSSVTGLVHFSGVSNNYDNINLQDDHRSIVDEADIIDNNKFLRIKPLNKNGAPARGATVTLTSNLREHSKTIDAGSGYLCQMEPVAHYGLREGEEDFKVSIKWTNGKTNNYKIKK